MTDLQRIEVRLAGLEPAFKAKVVQLILLLADRGLAVRIAYAKRTFLEQTALWLQGRAPRAEVDRARMGAGLAPLGLMERNVIVTNAQPGQSLHEKGLAVDLVPMGWMAATQKWLPDWASPRWVAIGEAAESLGLKWGGRWGKPDRPHVEMPA